MIGWSSRMLPTDRASFSNEDGSISGEMAGFHLKSDGWRWEEPWIVDVDVRKHDKEVGSAFICRENSNHSVILLSPVQGWEYATNFAGAVWKPENGVSSFVRRRLWKRHMRYTSLEKWAEVRREILCRLTSYSAFNLIQLPRSNELIVELAVGGFDMLPERECFLFALSKDGALLRFGSYSSYFSNFLSSFLELFTSVFRRVGIHANNPDGDCWHEIDGIVGEGSYYLNSLK